MGNLDACGRCWGPRLTIAGHTIKAAQTCTANGYPRWLRLFAFLFGMAVISGAPVQAVASIENRVSVKNERVDDISKIIRCAAFFQTIADFRRRRPGVPELLGQVSDSLLDLPVEYLTLDLTESADSAEIRAQAEKQRVGYITAYRAMLREQFGLARAATFVTYDLLMMQEDLKFCRDVIDDQGLAFDKPLPVR